MEEPQISPKSTCPIVAHLASPVATDLPKAVLRRIGGRLRGEKFRRPLLFKSFAHGKSNFPSGAPGQPGSNGSQGAFPQGGPPPGQWAPQGQQGFDFLSIFSHKMLTNASSGPPPGQYGQQPPQQWQQQQQPPYQQNWNQGCASFVLSFSFPTLTRRGLFAVLRRTSNGVLLKASNGVLRVSFCPLFSLPALISRNLAEGQQWQGQPGPNGPPQGQWGPPQGQWGPPRTFFFLDLKSVGLIL